MSPAELLEITMVVCFGISWPASIVRSYKGRTAKGKSLLFLVMIMTGYVAGVAAKLVSGNISYSVFFYALNLVMVATDTVLYFRNKRLDAQREAEAKKANA